MPQILNILAYENVWFCVFCSNWKAAKIVDGKIS